VKLFCLSREDRHKEFTTTISHSKKLYGNTEIHGKICIVEVGF